MDPSVTLTEYGYIVAADALGQMLLSPVFGVVSDWLGRIRDVEYCCIGTFFTGQLFYALIPLIPRNVAGLTKPRVWATFAARFIVGIGTGATYL